jgi:hypothetical protein
LTLRVSTLVKSDSVREEFPHTVGAWTIPIVVSTWDRAWYFLEEIGPAWQALVSLASGLGILASGVGLLHGFGLKIFGRAGRDAAPGNDAEMST